MTTFLYLALGICLTAIALEYPNLSSSLQTSLFINAGASYIIFILSTFPFWRETTIRIYRRQNSAVIIPWLVIGLNIVWMIWEVQSQNWTMEDILRAFSQLLVVLLFAEIIFITEERQRAGDRRQEEENIIFAVSNQGFKAPKFIYEKKKKYG
jgi:sterol desaturase/sphingolipid hydroxylase (fatty acid hydroxylase superfamily)